MRILQLTSNMHPVSPTFQKAIGSHVAWLANGLVDRGHEVHLFGAKDSETKAVQHGISASLSKSDLSPEEQRRYVLLNISRAYEFAQTGADIIHSHFTLLSNYFSPISAVPTLTSVHSPITAQQREVLSYYKKERFVSFSLAQRKQAPELNWYANIYHGVDTKRFAYNAEPKDYVLYLGRITEEKGTLQAILAAKEAGVPLLIAGASYPSEGYWQKCIEPHIDGVQVQYLGEADFERKIELLQNARALLFPTQTGEVFGYSMIEAMSCGTPVIGFDNGSVSEIVQEGVSGFVVNDAEGMAEAIKKINEIDRLKVRRRAEIYFSVEKMITGYQRVYKRILGDEKFRAQQKSQKEQKDTEKRLQEGSAE